MNQMEDKLIILSSDVRIPMLRDAEIKREPIAWPLFKNENHMAYIVTVPANTEIPLHSHDEDVFRLVIKGSLVLNREINVKEGMWFVGRAQNPYEIKTETGYTAFGDYMHRCPSRQPGGSFREED
jgi:hypothetical protein